MGEEQEEGGRDCERGRKERDREKGRVRVMEKERKKEEGLVTIMLFCSPLPFLLSRLETR